MIKILRDKSLWLVVLISGLITLGAATYGYYWWVTLPYKIGKSIIADF